MMAPAKAEIKVALIGHVSVGKTTVLNALFRDKFGEVSMKRTTAAVNYFRIVSKRPTEDKAEAGSTEEKSKQWADVASYDTKSAGCILKEITEDNKELRNASGIKEKFFDIELDDPLCDMRENTNLVVVDIPGINEAGVGSKYRDFVEKKWDKFDVAVLVMDGKQGVNTEEQLKLLQFVKSNQEAKRQIPLIILLNKVDDPDDEIQAVLVDESRQEVEKQFGCRIEEPLTTHNEPRKEAPIPVLIPTSAMHAYFYRTASQMTFDQFKSIDQELIEKMGREEIGRFKWKELSEDKRYQAVYDAVSGEGQYNERLEATNFDKLLSALKEIIGDEQTQLITLREQVLVTLSNLPKKQGLTDEFKSAYEKSKTVGMPAEPLRDMYWSMYEELEKRVIGAFVGPAARHVLSEPMIEMAIFYELACRASWEDDQKKALDRMRFLVRHLLVFIFKNVKECKEKMKTGTVVPKSPPLEWSDLSPLDWHSICSSFCY